MKTNTNTQLTILITFFIYTLCFSQTEDIPSRVLYQDFISNVNKSDLNTDFLLNKGFINDDEVESLAQFIESYDEEQEVIVPPMSNLDALSWTSTYKSILQSEFQSQNPLPSIEDITGKFNNVDFQETNIPLLFFDITGELLTDIEIDASIDGSRKNEEYNTIHFFGSSTYISNFYNKDISFKLDPKTYISELNSNKPDEIFIDFADGRGITKYDLTSARSINVSYPDLGEKIIKIYRDADLNGNNIRIGSSFRINIYRENTSDPSEIIEDVNTSNSNISGKSLNGSPISTIGGKAYCFNGNDNILDKPIIIVQGFDPVGDITLRSQQKKYFERGFETTLRQDGFDVIYVLFNDTNQSLQSNTDVLKNLIRNINTRKQGNFESVIIGESMGGLLSRMALKQLENEGYDAQAGLYISFDAPHQGANFPPGMQHLFKDAVESRTVKVINAIASIHDRTTIALANLYIKTFTGSNGIPNLRDVLFLNLVNDALESLNSTAAKSMLVRHISGNTNFNATQNTLKNLGYPTETRNIALINGSNQSNDLQQRFSGGNLTEGERVVRFPIYRTDCNEFSLNAWSSSTNKRATVSEIKLKIGIKVPEVKIKWESKCITPKIFGKCIKTKIPVKFVAGLQCATTNLIDKERKYTFNGTSYDDAPGSTIDGLNQVDLINVSADFSFVPTASAIDLSSTAYNSISDPNGLRAITSSTVLDNFIRNDQTPFDEIYSKTSNSAHVFFNDFFDRNNFRTIIRDEIQNTNMNIQNKNINFDRDFEATGNIILGNNVNNISQKMIKAGDVIIDNNAEVTFKANDSIILKDGVFINNGSNVSFKVSRTLAAKSLNSNNFSLEDHFQIKILGEDSYEVGEYPAFKVLTSNLDLDYNYEWELEGINKSGDEFVIEELLYPGPYMLKVNVTSNKTGVSRSITKVFNISNIESKELDINESLDDISSLNQVTIYPNPIDSETTLIATNEIKQVTLYDLSGKIILDANDIKTKKWMSLDLSSLSSGTYIIKTIFNNNQEISSKVIKK